MQVGVGQVSPSDRTPPWMSCVGRPLAEGSRAWDTGHSVGPRWLFHPALQARTVASPSIPLPSRCCQLHSGPCPGLPEARRGADPAVLLQSGWESGSEDPGARRGRGRPPGSAGLPASPRSAAAMGSVGSQRLKEPSVAGTPDRAVVTSFGFDGCQLEEEVAVRTAGGQDGGPGGAPLFTDSGE